jgi:hypothetical protein
MSQGQPRRPASSEQAQGEDGAIRYGDVFPAVRGGLAKKPVAPQDAATMQSAETLMFGETVKGGPAAAMQSASMRNERMGAVAHDQATDATAEQGVSVSETRVPGGRIVTEFVAGQVIMTWDSEQDIPVLLWRTCHRLRQNGLNRSALCRLWASTWRRMMMLPPLEVAAAQVWLMAQR